MCDVGMYIKLKYGRNVSIINDVSPKKAQYDDYDGTRVIVIDLKDSLMPVAELERFCKTDGGKLPCRFANKPDLSEIVIIASHLPFNKALTGRVLKKCFNGGVWKMSQKSAVTYIKAESAGENMEPPVSLQNVTLLPNKTKKVKGSKTIP